MPLTYVSNGPWGVGQGAPLNANQHDTNIYTLAQGIEALETALDGVVSVEDITASGNIVTFHLTNDTTIDIAIDLPSFTFRGTWLNNTAYAVNDIIYAPGLGSFLVLEPHTTPVSPAEFDPDETNGSDEPLYGLLVTEQSLAGRMRWRGDFPAEASILQYDVFRDDTFGVWIANSDHTSAETFDPYAVDGEDALLYTQIAPPPFSPVEEVSTTTYEVTPLDVGKYIRFTNAAGCEISFDGDIAVNAEIHLEQAGAGSLTFSETTATTIIPQRASFDTATPYEGAAITAKVVDVGTIKLIGPHGEEIT